MLNIIGLSLSLSIALVIYILVQFDFSHDGFHPNGKNIYRMVSNSMLGDMPKKSTAVEGPFLKAIKDQSKGIQFVSPVYLFNSDAKIGIRSANDLDQKREIDMAIVSTDYFDMFQYDWISGDKKSFDKPFSVVLTEDRAEQYFGTKDPGKIIGQAITYFDSIQASVTGILKPMPQNSELIFKEFLSFASTSNVFLSNRLNLNSWRTTNSGHQLFLMPYADYSIPNLTKELSNIRKNNIDKDLTEKYFEIILQNIKEIHFDTEYGNFKPRVANRATSKAMILIAIFFLFIGCANFINLSTACSPIRAKEIGIRKTLGSTSGLISLQFIMETTIILIFAIIGSLIILPFILSLFKNFIAHEINFRSIFQPHVVLFMISLFVVTVLAAGLYPSFILTKYQPVIVLKGGVQKDSQGILLFRRGLILLQLIVAQLFVLACIIVIKQIYFLVNKDPGFKKNAILSFSVPFGFHKDTSAFDKSIYFIEKLKAIPGIEIISKSGSGPISTSNSSGTINYYRDSSTLSIYHQIKYGDSLFFKLYGIPIIAGRVTRYTKDSTFGECIINETMVKALGISDPQQALGRSFGERHKPVIVGVCRDFNMKSYHTPIPPLIYISYMKNCSMINIGLNSKISKSEYPKILSQVSTVFNTEFPDKPFNYSFIDEQMSKHYNIERYIAHLLRWCMILAIIICNIGLIGMVINIVQNRLKEIGIRKILGASVFKIVGLILNEYVILIIMSTVFSLPIVYIFANKWLNGFAYRTDIAWWIFPIGTLLLIIVTLLTLSFNVMQAAKLNPVETMRNE